LKAQIASSIREMAMTAVGLPNKMDRLIDRVGEGDVELRIASLPQMRCSLCGWCCTSVASTGARLRMRVTRDDMDAAGSKPLTPLCQLCGYDLARRQWQSIRQLGMGPISHISRDMICSGKRAARRLPIATRTSSELINGSDKYTCAADSAARQTDDAPMRLSVSR